uniref:Snurportin-1 n=1 Tax=Phallusia mammillata TaxID=59560 RepID=A0A6F9DTE1_9ASCI|nr:snurportin-1-like [Phallusia mammillata]
MDNLVESLGASFQVSKTSNNIYANHPRFDQYKQKTAKSSDQNVRREKFLAKQKERRFNYQSHVRCLALDEWDSEEDDSNLSDSEMDTSETVQKPPKRYKDQLMLSEWLVEVPSDFEQEWVMRICPLGRRNLVVASRNRTCAYSKSGYCVNTFASALPGGSYDTNSGYTVLDCVFNEIDKTFYVLDVMCWNNHPMYDSETEFRLFWLHGKLSETPELAELTPNNSFKFVVVQNYPCHKEFISSALSTTDIDKVDGLLFYHKRTHYTFGATPLVTWLKVHMLKDILGIPPPNTKHDIQRSKLEMEHS